MRLSKVLIRNFRSIYNVTIALEPPCRVLVGINESGKTNILKALSLLDPQSKISPTDLRELRPGERFDQEAFIRFFFRFDESERAQLSAQAAPQVLARDPDAPLLEIQGRAASISALCEAQAEGLFNVDIKLDRRRPMARAFPPNAALIPGWKKPAPSAPSDHSIPLPDGSSQPLSRFAMVRSEDFPELPPDYLIDATLADVTSLIYKHVTALVEHALPKTIYWAYSDANLLPGQISAPVFSSNPDTCVPLKHMFQLAGIHDLPAEIAQARSRANGIRNLLNIVATQATRHMRNVWPEYKDLRICLSPNGEMIDAAIQDRHNLYDMSRRSDGFKRFITFLLLISTQVKTNDLVNTLLLYDEPDTSLHPSGARHIRDELIRISSLNYVVYATHSIFMIDPDQIARHLIVEKKDEVTSVRDVSESNFMDEEVIYNALGHSVFENLKPRNVLFEGWRDKRLFSVATTRWPASHRQIAGLYRDVGRCHARGARDVPVITAILELGRRAYLVLSDSDKPAREQQKQFRGEGEWLRYDELGAAAPAVTSEDFIRSEAFQPAIEALAAEDSRLSPLSHASLNDARGKLAALSDWLEQAGLSPHEVKAAIARVKDIVFSDLKPSNVEPRYYDILAALASRLPGLQHD